MGELRCVTPAQKDASPLGNRNRYNGRRPITSLASSSVRASMSGTVQDSLAANDELRDKPVAIADEAAAC